LSRLFVYNLLAVLEHVKMQLFQDYQADDVITPNQEQDNIFSLLEHDDVTDEHTYVSGGEIASNLTKHNAIYMQTKKVMSETFLL